MEYVFLEEVDSTNKYAKENLAKFEDKTVIYTSKQTAGRGRLERKWDFVGGENIYASIILKPEDKLKEVYSNLTQYLSVMISRTMESYGVEPGIKWPNDVLINGRKVSGILAESVLEKDNLAGIILGFGINLNCAENNLSKIDKPATSLNIELGKNIERDSFLSELLNRFFLLYDRFIEEGFSLIKDEYMRRAVFLNNTITVRTFDKEVTGLAVGVTDKGALRLKEKNKELVFLAGDIL